MNLSKSNKYILSIIIPIYKAEKYIIECIESLVSQVDSDMEIILVDDGSPDNCPEICNDYAEKYPNITVIHKKNAGSVSARRDGVDIAKGTYVTFVDADDWVQEGYFLKIREIIEEYHPDLIAVTRHYRAPEGKKPYIFQENDHEGFYDRFMLKNTFFPTMLYKEPFFTFGVSPSACTKVIKRSLLCRFIFDAPDQIRMGDDMAVTFPCMLHANSIFFTDCGGYFYRENPLSITHTFDPIAPSRVLCLLQYLQDKLCVSDVENMQYQIDMYSIHILCNTIGMLIQRSQNIEEDLEELEPLLSCEYVERGLKHNLPFKTRTLISMVRNKRILVLKVIRNYWLRSVNRNKIN